MGQNLDTRFSIHSKVLIEHLLYTVTQQRATGTCPVLPKLLGYQSPDLLVFFLTINPKYNTFSKKKKKSEITQADVPTPSH